MFFPEVNNNRKKHKRIKGVADNIKAFFYFWVGYSDIIKTVAYHNKKKDKSSNKRINKKSFCINCLDRKSNSWDKICNKSQFSRKKKSKDDDTKIKRDFYDTENNFVFFHTLISLKNFFKRILKNLFSLIFKKVKFAYLLPSFKGGKREIFIFHHFLNCIRSYFNCKSSIFYYIYLWKRRRMIIFLFFILILFGEGW